MRALAAIGILWLLPSPQPQDEERIYVDQATDDFQKRWAAAEEAGDWKQLADLHLYACDVHSHRLGQPDLAVKRWIRLPFVLSERLASMPEARREPFEAVVRELLATVQDLAARRQVIEKYGFTRAAQEALQAMANQDFDQGRVRDAIRAWTHGLEIRPTPELLARLANAHAALGDPAALVALKAQAERRGWKGEVVVAGKRRDLHEFLASLRPAGASTIPLQKTASRARPSSEIRLGHFDFKNDGNAFGRGMAAMVPGCAAVGGAERVVFSNGLKVIAIDPARAEGGGVEDAVEWRYPKEGQQLRYYMPTASSPPLPIVGASIEGRRAFVTMFSVHQNRQGQVGRRPDRFDGPAAIRAFDALTGELLWDIDTLSFEVDREGVKVLMIDKLPFGRLNFCFGGPPVVRGDRLYAAVMTSPMTERQCHVVCLDATTGRALWSTHIASAPPTRGATSVSSINEEDGTVVVATNFGAAAALDARTGEIEWLVKYPTTSNWRRDTVNPPVIHRSQVCLLPQDRDEPLVFDRWTGRERGLPLLSEDVSWQGVRVLLGKWGEWLVFAGAKCCAIRVTDGRVVELTNAEASGPGRGAIAGNLLYLPTRAALQVFDTTTWKLVDSAAWSGIEDSGNLVVTDSLLVFLGDRLDIATSRGALQERFAPKIEARSPRAVQCRQLAQILEAAGRPIEAVPYYRRALALWEKDPEWKESAEALRKKLAELAEKLGDEFPKE